MICMTKLGFLIQWVFLPCILGLSWSHLKSISITIVLQKSNTKQISAWRRITTMSESSLQSIGRVWGWPGRKMLLPNVSASRATPVWTPGGQLATGETLSIHSGQKLPTGVAIPRNLKGTACSHPLPGDKMRSPLSRRPCYLQPLRRIEPVHVMLTASSPSSFLWGHQESFSLSPLAVLASGTDAFPLTGSFPRAFLGCTFLPRCFQEWRAVRQLPQNH